MGLHRRQMVEKTFASHEEQLAAVRVFWSVYMFERRTSLGQGVPFYIQDSHIDPSLFAIVCHVLHTFLALASALMMC